MAATLIALGADIEATNCDDATITFLAQQGGNEKLIRLLDTSSFVQQLGEEARILGLTCPEIFVLIHPDFQSGMFSQLDVDAQIALLSALNKNQQVFHVCKAIFIRNFSALSRSHRQDLIKTASDLLESPGALQLRASRFAVSRSQQTFSHVYLSRLLECYSCDALVDELVRENKTINTAEERTFTLRLRSSAASLRYRTARVYRSIAAVDATESLAFSIVLSLFAFLGAIVLYFPSVVGSLVVLPFFCWPAGTLLISFSIICGFATQKICTFLWSQAGNVGAKVGGCIGAFSLLTLNCFAIAGIAAVLSVESFFFALPLLVALGSAVAIVGGALLGGYCGSAVEKSCTRVFNLFSRPRSCPVAHLASAATTAPSL